MAPALAERANGNGEIIVDAYRQLIAEFGRQCGIDDMRPDDDGTVDLELEDGVTLTLQLNADGDHLLLFTTVGLVGEAVGGDLLLELLSANLFGRETGGATLSLEPGTGQIVLYRAERLDGLLAGQLVHLVDRFADSAAFWAARLAPADAGLDDIGPGTDRSPSGFMQYKA